MRITHLCPSEGDVVELLVAHHKMFEALLHEHAEVDDGLVVGWAPP